METQEETNGVTSEDYEQEEERKHFCRIVSAFKSYKKHLLKKISEKEKYVKTLPPSHQALLDSYLRHLDQQKLCVTHNAEIIKLIIKDVENMFENVQHSVTEDDQPDTQTLNSDIDKVQSVLKHIMRDWTEEGKSERQLCYQPIIDRIETLFPPDKIRSDSIHILVPGAGLGRLSFELARRGFNCQGNEFSLFMLFTSNFVLNRLREENCLQLYPWCHGGSNLWSNADHLRLVSFPDTNPTNIPSETQFSMAAGDFLEIYKEDDSWDCIATCFFIDCANNIVAFIQTIYNILKPGGYWVNLGPLLYHFADVQGENSIEPTYELVRQIIQGVGFNIIDERCNVKTVYTQNEKSMLNYEYSSAFFTAQKPT